MIRFYARPAAIFVFVLALVPGLAMTANVHFAGERKIAAEFARAADLAVDRVASRVRQHIVALRAARGLWAAMDGRISRADLKRFVDSVDLLGELAGIRGIGYAPMIPAGDMAAIEASIVAEYGVSPRPAVASDQDWRVPVKLVEPVDAGTLRALGYDMYSEPTRRAAIDKAVDSGLITMSAPIQLVGNPKPGNNPGVLIFLPFTSVDAPGAVTAAPVSGFIYAPFRGPDLIEAALSAGPSLQVAMKVTDAEAPELPLYEPDTAASGLMLVRTASVLGRKWIFEITDTANLADPWRHIGTAVLGLISFLFAGTTAYAIAARQEEVATARALAAAAAREADYRELLLQEMKHRIKNYITRVQSIARQSARGATDVKAFSETFDARLQAMAAVQEILAGNIVPQADVRAILRKEMQQCLDTDEVEHLLNGPPVRLDERQAHAFAMVVHELVTNALKYGGLSPRGQGLQVSWSTRPSPAGDGQMLHVDWEERFPHDMAAPPAAAGFGSRLIEASLRGELSGSLQREYRPDGLQISVSFPLEGGAGEDRQGAPTRPT